MAGRAGKAFSSWCSFNSPLFVQRPEAKFQPALEQARRVRLRQRGGLKDSALDGVVITFVAARFYELRLPEDLSSGQQRHFEDRFRVADDVGRQQDVAADLGADLVGPGGERAARHEVL